VIPSERCGQHPIYLVANFLSRQSYSPSAAGSFRGLSSPPVNNSGNRIRGNCFCAMSGACSPPSRIRKRNGINDQVIRL